MPLAYGMNIPGMSGPVGVRHTYDLLSHCARCPEREAENSICSYGFCSYGVSVTRSTTHKLLLASEMAKLLLRVESVRLLGRTRFLGSEGGNNTGNFEARCSSR